jgi:hypothetical protein
VTPSEQVILRQAQDDNAKGQDDNAKGQDDNAKGQDDNARVRMTIDSDDTT